jgi:ribonucleoside-diphosphate reductase alpha chain
MPGACPHAENPQSTKPEHLLDSRPELYYAGPMNHLAPTSLASHVPVARDIWDRKYRFKRPDGSAEASLDESFARVAAAVAAPEEDSANWRNIYTGLLTSMSFIPAGRILAGAGTGRVVTLFNCFVMGTIADSIPGIFDSLKEAAQTLQQGGGIGHDFSTLRPKGALVHSVGADASGPLSFMDCWDAMCRTIMSAGARRGAMMGTLRCDHPDIEAFIDAKRDGTRLRNFNVSVLVTDAFMAALKANAPWPLVFDQHVYKTVNARDLWQRIMRATYDAAEPGVIFIDRINASNPLAYCEMIACTNPCGEQPLPPYGACLLGSLNLTRFVNNPYTDDARLDMARLTEASMIAVRFLDGVIDVSNFPLPQQKAEALAKRRLGLGVTGLADALVMCGLRYGSEPAAAVARQWMAAIQRAAIIASAGLAREKGAFPLFDRGKYLATAYAATLPQDLRDVIAHDGLRNGLLTSIAPTGTISLLAGNVSSGVEPVFSADYDRRILLADGTHEVQAMTDFALAGWRGMGRSGVPPNFVTAAQLKPAEHLAMQAALQPHVDSSISKTINVPETCSFEDFAQIYEQAYTLGLKGCTTFRPNAVTGSILTAYEDARTCPSCGSSDFEAREGCLTCLSCGFALCG